MSKSVCSADEVTAGILLANQVGPGDYYDTIELRLDGSEHVMRVPVHLRIVETITLVPSTVVLRQNPEKGGFLPVDLLVLDRRDDGKLDGVKLLASPTGFRIEDVGAVNARCRRLRLIVAEDAAFDRESRLTLTWDDGATFAHLKVVGQ